MKTPHFFSIIILLISIPVYGQQKSQETATILSDSIRSKTQLLNEMTIVGSRYKLRTFDRTESISLLQLEPMNSNTQMSMAHQLSQVSGVWMQKTNHGGGSPFVRGLTGYQVLILLDGVRFNNSTFRSGPNQYANTIDAFNIERIELLKGAGAVPYGSDAIGGTIALYSKTPYFSTDKTKISGSIMGRMMSHGMEKSTRAELRIAGKRMSVLGGLTYQDFEDIRAGGSLGTLENTGYLNTAYDFKLKWKLSPRNTLTLAHQKMTQNDIPLYHKLVNNAYSTYHFDPQQRNLSYLRLSSSNKNPYFSQVIYTISYQKSLEIRKKQKSGQALMKNETDKVGTIGATIEVVSIFDKSWKSSSGLEFYGDKIASTSVTTDQTSGSTSSGRGLYADNSRYLNFGAFTSHQINQKHWNFNIGFRYNLFRLQVPDLYFGNSELTISKLVGNIGISYKINSSNRLIFGASSAFRAPNINDVSSFGIADFRYEVPNNALKPESSMILEAGWKMKTDNFSLGIFGFRNKLTDLITNTKSSYNGLDMIEGYDVYKRENSNKAYIWGNEMDMEYQLSSKFSSYLNLYYTYGKDLSKDEPMRRIPPLFGRLGGRFSGNRLILGLEGNFALKQNRLSSGDIADSRIKEGGTPAWKVINLNAGFRIHNIIIQSGIENIFDTEYRVHGSGVDGLGRNIWMAMVYDF